MLEYINLFLIIVIIGVLTYEIVTSVSKQNEIDILRASMKNEIDNLKAKQTPIMGLMDLKEFRNLDPGFKDNYQKYVVDGVVPVVTGVANEFIAKNNMNKPFPPEIHANLRAKIAQIGPSMRSSFIVSPDSQQTP